MIRRLDPRRWATKSHERALVNARAAATECARRAVERAEVESYLARLTASVRPAAMAAADPA